MASEAAVRDDWYSLDDARVLSETQGRGVRPHPDWLMTHLNLAYRKGVQHGQAALTAERDALADRVAALNERLDATECACSDEEAAHRDTLRLLELRDVRIAELESALHHMRWCRDCGESSWADCDGGRAALAALGIDEEGNPLPDAALKP